MQISKSCTKTVVATMDVWNMHIFLFTHRCKTFHNTSNVIACTW